jgi:hypothetical protein
VVKPGTDVDDLIKVAWSSRIWARTLDLENIYTQKVIDTRN